MKKFFRISTILLLVLSGLAINSCKKNEEPKIVKEKISGQVQKGPYVNGTSITMYELNTSLSQTGNSFSTQIISNKGSFEINNINLSSSYVEFNASGYYFDEIKGELSVSPLNLVALADIRDISTVNVNIMTHLEKQRVDNLIKQNRTFAEAKKTAQTEILSIFGFSLSGISNSEALDISVNSESNAILLAISVILQGNRSVGDLTELLANISNDLKDNGSINNANLISDLRASAKQLKTDNIRTNLEKRYQDLGIAATIPGFEKYINDFLAYTGEKPSAATLQPIDVATTSVKFNGTVNPNSLTTTVIFEWGKTSAYGDSIYATQGTITGSSSVNVDKNITTLIPGTTYHFRVKARNTKGTSTGEDLTFTTLGQKPTASTLTGSNITATSVTMNGSVNPNLLSTTVQFQYGITTSYGDSVSITQNPITGNVLTSVTIQVTGLSEGTTYHYRIKAANALGTTYGSDMTFKTTNLTGSLPASDIKATSATFNGTINANISFSSVSFEYGTTSSYGNNITAVQNSADAGAVSITVKALVTGLTDGTTYHYRLVATSSQGTINGEDIIFNTFPGSVTDIEGNAYKVVVIGTQIWMAENLKAKKYNNGTNIPNVADIDSWNALTTGAYCDYGNNPSNSDIYGRLYNWYAVNPNDLKNVCPINWHVPTNAEWFTMANYLVNHGYNYDGSYDGYKIAKSLADLSNWIINSTTPGVPGSLDYPEVRNKSGFSALPGGYRDGSGSFQAMGYSGFWQTSTEYNANQSWNIAIFGHENYFSGANQPKQLGYSVRCVKDK